VEAVQTAEKTRTLTSLEMGPANGPLECAKIGLKEGGGLIKNQPKGKKCSGPNFTPPKKGRKTREKYFKRQTTSLKRAEGKTRVF